MKRHVKNKNIHAGNGTIIPFTEYLAGVNSGLYNPYFDNDRYTQDRAIFDHQVPGQSKISQKDNVSVESTGTAQLRKGAEIYFRTILESLARDYAEDLKSVLKDQPGETKLALIAYYLKQYDLASAGEIDLASEIERVVAASDQVKLWKEVLSKFSGSTQLVTKNNEADKAKDSGAGENHSSKLPRTEGERKLM